MHRFARKSHDRGGDEHRSAATTAQTFFLNPRRPRSSSRPMIRNVMTPSQESNSDDRSARSCYFDPATIILSMYLTTGAKGARRVQHVLYTWIPVYYTSRIGQIFRRNRHLCLSLSYGTIIYAILFTINALSYCRAHSHTHITYMYTRAQSFRSAGVANIFYRHSV